MLTILFLTTAVSAEADEDAGDREHSVTMENWPEPKRSKPGRRVC
jgi:hypothetical protein